MALYNVSIKHTASNENAVADALYRNPHKWLEAEEKVKVCRVEVKETFSKGTKGNVQ